MPSSRRIWVLADPHIGHVSDGRDGGEWLDGVTADRHAHLGPMDYALNLGDVSHAAQDDQFARWAAWRDGCGVSPWFEIVGNHDFAGLETGAYQRQVRRPRYWSMLDGNLAFFSLPAERGNAAGLLIPPVEAWLREQIAAAGRRNIIIVAHQFPYETVARSTQPARCLYPRDAVERFLGEVHVDLWLGGHIHSGGRTAAWSAVRNGTTFINAASASHTYNTGMCNTFVLELAAGSAEGVARCRDHDGQRWLDDFQVPLRFAYPFEPAEPGPVFMPADLVIPPHYSRIDDEQVAGF